MEVNLSITNHFVLLIIVNHLRHLSIFDAVLKYFRECREQSNKPIDLGAGFIKNLYIEIMSDVIKQVK